MQSLTHTRPDAGQVSSKARRRGFTLIELLVVIAIIAILAAILFPVFARARENARRASCSSNLKNIGLGVIQYEQDYDESFPLLRNNAGAFPANGNGFGGVWVAIQPYLKSTQILQCPSEPTPPQDCGTSYTAGCGDYAYNLLLGWDVPNGKNRGLAIAAVNSVATTVMILDGIARYGDEWSAGCGIDSGPLPCGAPGLATFGGGDNKAAQRHLETQNVLFCDGHVKAYKGQTPTDSAAIYNSVTPGSGTGVVSGNNPTFNYAAQ